MIPGSISVVTATIPDEESNGVRAALQFCHRLLQVLPRKGSGTWCNQNLYLIPHGMRKGGRLENGNTDGTGGIVFLIASVYAKCGEIHMHLPLLKMLYIKHHCLVSFLYFSASFYKIRKGYPTLSVFATVRSSTSKPMNAVPCQFREPYPERSHCACSNNETSTADNTSRTDISHLAFVTAESRPAPLSRISQVRPFSAGRDTCSRYIFDMPSSSGNMVINMTYSPRCYYCCAINVKMMQEAYLPFAEILHNITLSYINSMY